jgi:hypothetical protein
MDNLCEKTVNRIYTYTLGGKINWNSIDKTTKLNLIKEVPALLGLEIRQSFYFKYKTGTFYLFKVFDKFLLCFRKFIDQPIEVINNSDEYDNELKVIYDHIVQSRISNKDFLEDFLTNTGDIK